MSLKTEISELHSVTAVFACHWNCFGSKPACSPLIHAPASKPDRQPLRSDCLLDIGGGIELKSRSSPQGRTGHTSLKLCARLGRLRPVCSGLVNSNSRICG